MKKLIAILSSVIILSVATPSFAQTCKVQRGDSLWKISKEYHHIFEEVLRLNKHRFKDVNVIHPNDKVELPEDNSTGTHSNQNSETDEIKEGNEDTADRKESTQAQEVLKLVNQERAKQGLSALTLDTKLTSIANMKAADMRDKNYFDHTSPTYGTPFQMLQNYGVTYRSAGENIAAGQRSASEVMNSWMNSSGHRANILNKNYKKLGVGYVTGGSYGTYWVQLFVQS